MGEDLKLCENRFFLQSTRDGRRIKKLLGDMHYWNRKMVRSHRNQEIYDRTFLSENCL